PTGDQRDELKDAFALGTTLAYRVTPALSIVGNFGWSPSEAKATSAAAADDNDLDLFQYDAGVELGRDFSLGASAWTWRPFIGIGAGARTYSFRDRDVDSETDFAGYGAAGVQFDAGRFGLRLEARDYLSRFDGLDGHLSESSTRHDLFLTGALSGRAPSCFAAAHGLPSIEHCPVRRASAQPAAVRALRPAHLRPVNHRTPRKEREAMASDRMARYREAAERTAEEQRRIQQRVDSRD